MGDKVCTLNHFQREIHLGSGKKRKFLLLFEVFSASEVRKASQSFKDTAVHTFTGEDDKPGGIVIALSKDNANYR